MRLGVSVGRRVGGAVERNRVKRLLREAFWALDEQLPEDHDFVIVARAGAAEVAERRDRRGARPSSPSCSGGSSPARRNASV